MDFSNEPCMGCWATPTNTAGDWTQATAACRQPVKVCWAQAAVPSTSHIPGWGCAPPARHHHGIIAVTCDNDDAVRFTERLHSSDAGLIATTNPAGASTNNEQGSRLGTQGTTDRSDDRAGVRCVRALRREALHSQLGLQLGEGQLGGQQLLSAGSVAACTAWPPAASCSLW